MNKLLRKPFVYRSRSNAKWRVEYRTDIGYGRDRSRFHLDKADSWQEAIERALWLVEFYDMNG